MLSLKRLLCCSLILAAEAISQSSSVAHAQAPDSRPKPTGSISGRVTIGDKAASGAMVAAFADSPNRRPVAQVPSDSEGHYVLSGLAPGQYNVTVVLPGFVGSGNSFYGAGKAVALSLNEAADSVDFRLVRGGVITGCITDADHKPVMEERVNLMAIDENGNVKNQPGPLPYNYLMLSSDDRGIYRLYGLPAGRYKVSVGANPNSGFITTGPRGYYKQTFYPDVNDPAKATIIELSEGGEAANIDIVVGRRSSTHSVTGHVIDADTHDPIGNVQVAYGALRPNQNFFAGYMVLPVNARGDFHLEGLEPGRYGVQIASQYYGGGYYSELTFFEVVDSDVSDIEVKAIRGLSLSGVVVPDGITSREVLALLPSLRVYANVPSMSATIRTSSSGSSAIAGDGSFQINGLRPGKASIYVSGGNNRELHAFSLSRIERDGVQLSQGFEIAPGQDASGLQLFVTYGMGTIRGSVTITGGTLPPETRLTVRVARQGSISSGNSAQVDSRGHFMITNLAAGTYEVTLQKFPPARTQAGKRPPPPLSQIVAVGDGAETEITFTLDLSSEGGP